MFSSSDGSDGYNIPSIMRHIWSACTSSANCYSCSDNNPFDGMVRSLYARTNAQYYVSISNGIPSYKLSFTQCVHPDGHCARNRTSSEDNESSNPLSHESPATSSNAFSRSTLHATNIHMIDDDVTGDIDISSVPNLATPPPPMKGWGGLSRYHIIGTGLIFLAVMIGLTPAVLSLDHIVITKKDAIPDRTAYK